MIHEIGLELKAALVKRGCTFAVDDGPERTNTTTFGRERIVIEYDESDDSFSPPHGTRPNPKHRFTCAQACKLTIYAQEPHANATEFEHRRRAAHVRDLVLVCLYDVAVARRNAWAPKSGHFTKPDDLKASEVIAGAVYELKFTFDRAIIDQTWAGASQPEATLGANGLHVTSTTKASRAGAAGSGFPGDPPAGAETSCVD